MAPELLPEARILPGNPGAGRTTGRTGTMARAGTTFALEVARCYEQRRDDPGVFLHLVSAEASGPEDMRYNTLARDLVHGLLKRARPTYAPQVRQLARRIDLLA
jgi:hypothetical protein